MYRRIISTAHVVARSIRHRLARRATDAAATPPPPAPQAAANAMELTFGEPLALAFNKPIAFAPDRFQRSLLLLKLFVPVFGYGAALYYTYEDEPTHLEHTLTGARDTNMSTTQMVRQRFLDETDKYNKPGQGEGANTAEIINPALAELLGSFLAEDNTTSCLVVTGPRGTGKSFTVDHAINTAIDDANIRVVYVKAMSIRRIEDLVHALEDALSVRRSELTVHIGHWLSLGNFKSQSPLERFKYLLGEINRVARKHGAKHKFVFVIDDFEELQAPPSPELHDALHYLVRQLSAWGTNNLVLPIVVSSTRDAEKHFIESRETSFNPVHVTDLTPEEARAYILRKIHDRGDEAARTKAAEKIVNNIGVRVADLRLACQQLLTMTAPLTLAADKVSAKMQQDEKRRLAAFWRTLGAEEQRYVGSALRFATANTRIMAALNKRSWRLLFHTSSSDIRSGLDLLVEQGIFVEQEDGEVSPATPLVANAMKTFVTERYL